MGYNDFIFYDLPVGHKRYDQLVGLDIVGRTHPQKGNHGDTYWKVLDLWKND
jgi:hypothetical protein